MLYVAWRTSPWIWFQLDEHCGTCGQVNSSVDMVPTGYCVVCGQVNSSVDMVPTGCCVVCGQVNSSVDMVPTGYCVVCGQVNSSVDEVPTGCCVACGQVNSFHFLCPFCEEPGFIYDCCSTGERNQKQNVSFSRFQAIYR